MLSSKSPYVKGLVLTNGRLPRLFRLSVVDSSVLGVSALRALCRQQSFLFSIAPAESERCSSSWALLIAGGYITIRKNVVKLLFFLFGAAVGSFLNVCIDRLPSGMSIISPPSHCPSCRKRLAVKDLVPVFSYLWLRGRCRYCRAEIPMRLLWVELGTGALFVFLYWHYGLSWQFAVTGAYCCLFIVVMVIDLEHQIIPNRIVYPGMALALVLSLLARVGVLEIDPEIVSAVIGGGAGFVLLLLPALVYRGGMGFGDVKLAGLIGLVTGFPLVIVALFMAIVGGGIVAAVLLLLKKKRWRQGIAFGPFLALGAMATLFWGSDILGWYLGLF